MENRLQAHIMKSWKHGAPPLLSVICPTFNHLHFLAQALDSILAQETTFAFEVLVNDDASTDGTQAILAAYAERYPAIIKPVYQQKNQYQQGKTIVPGLLNRAMGKYIAWCDGDDFWMDPHKLQIQVDFLESHLDYAMTYHDAFIFDGSDNRGLQLTGTFRSDASSVELMQARPLSTLTTCFRNVIHEMPLELQHAPVLDICIWSLVGAHGKGKFLGEIKPAAYRVHPSGVFSMRSDKQKLHMTLHTYLSLANYYHGIGKQALYEHFLVQVFSLSLSAISPWRVKFKALQVMVWNVGCNLFKRLAASASRS